MVDESSGGFFGILDNSRRIGRYVWAESRLHDVLADWVTVSPEPQVAALFGRHVHLHAWHAKLWRKRLPVLWDRDTTAFVGPADTGVSRLFDELAALRDPAMSLERVVAHYKVVVPHLLAAYGEHLEMTDPLTDSPTVRTLQFVIDDGTACWNDGDELLRSMVGSTREGERGADAARRFEELVAAAGGLAD
jgi:hypothetical protein